MKKSSSLKFIMVFIMMFKALFMVEPSYAQAERPDRFFKKNGVPFEDALKQITTDGESWVSDDWAGYGSTKLTKRKYLDIVAKESLQPYFPNETVTAGNAKYAFQKSVTVRPIGDFEVANYMNSNGEVSWEMQHFDGTWPVQAYLKDDKYIFLAKVKGDKLCFNPMRGSMPNDDYTKPEPEIIIKKVEVPGETVYQTDTVHDTTFVYTDRWHYYTEKQEVFREGYSGGASVMFAWGVSYDQGYSCTPYQQPYVVQNYYNIDNSINNSFNTTTTTITHPQIHHNPTPTPTPVPTPTHGGPGEANGGNPVINPDVSGGASESAGGKFARRNVTNSNHRNMTNNYSSNTNSRPQKSNGDIALAKPKARENYNPAPRPKGKQFVKNNHNDYSKPQKFERPRKMQKQSQSMHANAKISHGGGNNGFRKGK